MEDTREITWKIKQRIGVSAILKEAFRLFTTRFRAWIVPLLAIQLPFFLVVVGMVGVMMAMAFNTSLLRSPMFLFSFLGMYGLYFLVLLAQILLGIPCNYAQYAAMLSPGASGGASLKFAFARYGRALGTTLLAGLISAGAMMAAYIVGLIPVFAGSFALGFGFAGNTPVPQGALIALYVVAMVVYIVLMIAFTLTGATISSLAIPASIKEDLGAVKSVKYSLSRIGPVFFGGAGALTILTLSVAAIMIALMVPFIVSMVSAASSASFARYSMMPDAGMVGYMIAICAVALVLSAISVPAQIAVQCAMYNLSARQLQEGADS